MTPANDGIDHINIYYKGKTSLGKLLSNLAHTPIEIPEDGIFQSVEGYWFWLGTSKRIPRRESLRDLYGTDARKTGKILCDRNYMPTEKFHKKIYIAFAIKVASNKTLHNLLYKSTLPFTHYYVYGNNKIDAGFEWQIECWNKIRQYLKQKDAA